MWITETEENGLEVHTTTYNGVCLKVEDYHKFKADPGEREVYFSARIGQRYLVDGVCESVKLAMSLAEHVAKEA